VHNALEPTGTFNVQHPTLNGKPSTINLSTINRFMGSRLLPSELDVDHDLVPSRGFSTAVRVLAADEDVRGPKLEVHGTRLRSIVFLFAALGILGRLGREKHRRPDVVGRPWNWPLNDEIVTPYQPPAGLRVGLGSSRSRASPSLSNRLIPTSSGGTGLRSCGV
jgi:hypothetical protein